MGASALANIDKGLHHLFLSQIETLGMEPVARRSGIVSQLAPERGHGSVWMAGIGPDCLMTVLDLEVEDAVNLTSCGPGYFCLGIMSPSSLETMPRPVSAPGPTGLVMYCQDAGSYAYRLKPRTPYVSRSLCFTPRFGEQLAFGRRPDGDALLDRDTAAWLVAPLIHYPHVGAVTGNPRIRTRSTLIGRIQVGEFSSIIGLIKRTQRIYGRVFTVSGVIAAFRRQALADVGYWSPDMITEDIDISWKLQLRHWDIFFEPRALCWILMPETLKGLWKQRLRWAQGGAEVFLVNLRRLFHWQHHRMWPLFLEYACSTLWAFAYAITILLFILSRLMPLPDNLAVHTLFPPEFTGMLLGLMCLLQFVASLYIERRYEKKVAKSLFWVIWFPMVYWMIGLLTTLVAFPKVMVKRQRSRARWVSPDRGKGSL